MGAYTSPMNYEYKFCFLTTEGFENFRRTYSVSFGDDPSYDGCLIATELFAGAKYALKKWRSDGETILMTPLVECDDDAPDWVKKFCIDLDGILTEYWDKYWNA